MTEDQALTKRQREILNATVDEGSYAGAARALGVSVPTVKNTLAVVYRKLDVATGPQAVKRLAEIDAGRPFGKATTDDCWCGHGYNEHEPGGAACRVVIEELNCPPSPCPCGKFDLTE